MPKVRPLTHVLVSTNVPAEFKNFALGSFEDMERERATVRLYPEDAAYANLPYDYYWTYAPAAHGRLLRDLGNDNAHTETFDFIIEAILEGRFEAQETAIKTILEQNGPVKFHIIHDLYEKLARKFSPWSLKKQEILNKYRPEFSKLVDFGAKYDHLHSNMITDLIEHAMTGQALTRGLLSHVTVSNHANSFFEFQRLATLCLPKGADINALHFYNPDFGSFLNYYLAFEYPHAVELIGFIESQRGNSANTKYNYEAKDGFGHTPLLVALLTRNEKAALTLLHVNQKNIRVGINIPDKEGISPLLIAAALGMDEVVKELIRQGADVCAQDAQGRGLSQYAAMDANEVSRLLSRFMNPLRSNVKNSHFHSELYCIDGEGQSTPICLYEDGEKEVTGDAQMPYVVILSNRSPHKERQDRVLQILEQRAAQGKEWAKKNLNFVRRQIDDIRFGQKYQAVVDFLEQKPDDGLAVALRKHIQSLWAQYLPYEEVLNKGLAYLNTKHKGNPDALSLKQKVQSLIAQTPAAPAVLDLCLQGQERVQSYLQSKAAQDSILHSKGKNLRRACALGQVDTLSQLLQEGVNPNHIDHLKRSALHYAVMRTELVKAEFLKEAEERGEAKPMDLDNRASQAMRAHPKVIDVLMTYPHLDYKLQNKSNNTAMNVLLRDVKESDPLSQEIAQICLNKVKTVAVENEAQNNETSDLQLT